MASADEIRDAQRAAWGERAAAWEKWSDVITGQLAPVGAAMIDALDLATRQHLDVASGTGEPGLTIAAQIPAAHVVLTDLSAPMLAVAARRAAAAGITNVTTVVASADDLPFADETFDGVSVRLGLMFFPDLTAATAELVRVLRPGGRLCAAVWVEPDRNPWVSIPAGAVAAEIPPPPVDPDGLSMFRCSAPGFVRDLFEGAGLVDVAERDVDVELVTASPDEFWETISEHVAPVVHAVAAADDATRERIRASVIDAVQPYRRDDRVAVPGLARCIVGTKPRA
ncbi:class I SAM-dependent methyltransferase [Cellulomonas sp. JH27-2]|uniref:methyltransferase domain-containing protein n=1 Tax=Cellulomonas sp. JH27-2 TaxID=2774139 RepID=UPI001785BA49|nr:methyltransferase domain-containing protein [Cellulomonas sp. JH27-2]MBD8057799.1 class I SAM-dependent methyltransferase [Cellulomonas sp. JH27-2]